jgi:hypothetical protein
MAKACHKLPQRVRKLKGKPAFFTIADCESEARRIHYHETELSVPAAECNTSSIHSARISLDAGLIMAEFSC